MPMVVRFSRIGHACMQYLTPPSSPQNRGIPRVPFPVPHPLFVPGLRPVIIQGGALG